MRLRRRERGRGGYRSPPPGAPIDTRLRRARAISPGGTDVSVVPWPGAASSATTWPRSVTRTASPLRTCRMYSLKRFLSSRTPTVFMQTNVASCGYIVNADSGTLTYRLGLDALPTAPCCTSSSPRESLRVGGHPARIACVAAPGAVAAGGASPRDRVVAARRAPRTPPSRPGSPGSSG